MSYNSGLTDAQIRATPVPISGTVTANFGSIAGVATETTLAALNTKVTAVNTGAVTISTALPTGANVIGAVTQSGTWNVGSITTLPALATGTNTIGNVNMLDADTVGTGTISVTDAVVAAPAGAGAFVTGTSTAGSYVFVACPGGDSAWNIQITGLTTGTLYFEGSLDSTNGIDGQWINVNGRQTGVVNTVLAGNSTTNGLYRGNTSGLKYLRIRSVGALTGTPAIVIRISGGVGAIFLNASIPAGTNAIGSVSRVDTTASGTITAISQSVALALNGKSGASIQITGTWVGTLQFEGTVDGTNWVAVNGVYAGTSTPATTISANGLVRLTPSGLAQLRITSTAWTSGTATITMRASDATGGTFLNQSLTAGTNVIGALVANQSVNNAQINGVAVTTGTGISGTGVQRVTLATDIALPPAAAAPTTYSAAVVGLASALTATDIFTITGSATKTIRVTRIIVNGVQTTASQVNVLVVRRSTANSAGTSTASTAVSYDSTNAAATATVLAYTANPTLGTAVGTVSARRAFIPGAAAATDAQGLEIISGDVGQQMMTLRGIAQVLAVNLNSTTIAGSAFNITVEWTEA